LHIVRAENDDRLKEDTCRFTFLTVDIADSAAEFIANQLFE